MSERLTILVKLTVKPEYVDEFRTRNADLLDGTRSDAGCIVFDVLEDEDDPTNWYLYEDWETVALSDTHREKPEITAFLRDWKHMLQKPPERTRLKLIGDHGPFGQTR